MAAKELKIPLTRFELQLKVGIAVDLRRIRESDLGVTLETAVAHLGWSTRMELNRFETASDEEHHIPLDKYIAVMRYYFEIGAAGPADEHPAGTLLDDPALKTVGNTVRRRPLMLYQYLGLMRALALAQQIPATHHAVVLGNYLANLGSRALHRGRVLPG